MKLKIFKGSQLCQSKSSSQNSNPLRKPRNLHYKSILSQEIYILFSPRAITTKQKHKTMNFNFKLTNSNPPIRLRYIKNI